MASVGYSRAQLKTLLNLLNYCNIYVISCTSKVLTWLYCKCLRYNCNVKRYFWKQLELLSLYLISILHNAVYTLVFRGSRLKVSCQARLYGVTVLSAVDCYGWVSIALQEAMLVHKTVANYGSCFV